MQDCIANNVIVRNSKKPKLSSCCEGNDISAHRPSERAPAPTRFVRKPSKEAKTETQTTSSQSNNGSAYCEGNPSAAIKIDDDVWRIFNTSTHTNAHAAYYIAHRHHVAGEIRKSAESNVPEGSDQWEEILKSMFIRSIDIEKNEIMILCAFCAAQCQNIITIGCLLYIPARPGDPCLIHGHYAPHFQDASRIVRECMQCIVLQPKPNASNHKNSHTSRAARCIDMGVTRGKSRERRRFGGGLGARPHSGSIEPRMPLCARSGAESQRRRPAATPPPPPPCPLPPTLPRAAKPAVSVGPAMPQNTCRY